MKAGAEVVAVLDATPFTAKLRALSRMLFAPATLAKGVRYVADLKRAGIAMHSGVSRPRAEGDGHVERIVFEAGGVEQAIACDALGASFGLRSETQLADLAGCRFAFEPRTRQYLPERDAAGRTSRKDDYVAGTSAASARYSGTFTPAGHACWHGALTKPSQTAARHVLSTTCSSYSSRK